MKREPYMRIFEDPDWHLVEEMILKYVEPLKDMSTIDVKQPAEQVKAEVIGRIYAYNSLVKFLNTTKIISAPLKKLEDIFK